MTGTAVEYFSNLRRYFAILGWQEQGPILLKARKGLSMTLKDEVARQPFPFLNLDDLAQFCIFLDNQLRARKAERDVENKSNDNSSSNSQSHSNSHSISGSKDHSNRTQSSSSPTVVIKPQAVALVMNASSNPPFQKLSREDID